MGSPAPQLVSEPCLPCGVFPSPHKLAPPLASPLDARPCGAVVASWRGIGSRDISPVQGDVGSGPPVHAACSSPCPYPQLGPSGMGLRLRGRGMPAGSCSQSHAHFSSQEKSRSLFGERQLPSQEARPCSSTRAVPSVWLCCRGFRTAGSSAPGSSSGRASFGACGRRSGCRVPPM